MNITRSLSLSCLAVAALLPGLVACAASSGTEESTGSTSEDLCPVGVRCGPVTPPPAPTTPPGTYVTLASADLQFALNTLLNGTTLSIDTTGTAPPVQGPNVKVTNPEYTDCEASFHCYSYTGPALAQCEKAESASCSKIPPTISEPSEYTSYVTFSPYAISQGAQNELFPLKTLSYSDIVTFDIDINYLHGTLYNGEIQAYYVPGTATSTAAVSIYLPSGILTSNSPTLIISNAPDVNFTNMAIGVTLGNLTPTSDGLSLDYDTAESVFSCDSDINDIPDGLVNVFYDINTAVENAVESQMSSTFAASSSHKAFSEAFTTLVGAAVATVHPAGYSKLTNVVLSGTNLHVYYTPK